VALRAIRADKGIPSATRVVALLSVNDDYKKTILDGYRRSSRSRQVPRGARAARGQQPGRRVLDRKRGDRARRRRRGDVPLEGVVGAQDAAQEKAS